MQVTVNNVHESMSGSSLVLDCYGGGGKKLGAGTTKGGFVGTLNMNNDITQEQADELIGSVLEVHVGKSYSFPDKETGEIRTNDDLIFDELVSMPKPHALEPVAPRRSKVNA